jgi:hypothetical protein
MPNKALESLQKRVEALEAALTAKTTRSGKDWRKVIGMFGDSEFMREVDEECLRMREQEREAAGAGSHRDDPDGYRPCDPFEIP